MKLIINLTNLEMINKKPEITDKCSKIQGGALLITILSICNMFNYTIMSYFLNLKEIIKNIYLYTLGTNLKKIA